MEKRNRPIMVYMEDFIYNIARDSVATPRNMSMSTYLRALLVKDLMRKNLLPTALRDATVVGIENLLDEVAV